MRTTNTWILLFLGHNIHLTSSSAVFVKILWYIVILLSWCYFKIFFLGVCPDWIRELWGSTECYILNEWSWTSYTNYHCWLGFQQWFLCQWNDEKKEYQVCIYTIFFFFLFEKLLRDDLLFIEKKKEKKKKEKRKDLQKILFEWGNSLWQWLKCI